MKVNNLLDRANFIEFDNFGRIVKLVGVCKARDLKRCV